MHNGIRLYEIPQASGKKIRIGASLDLPGEITTMEFLAFQFNTELCIFVDRDGRPKGGYYKREEDGRPSGLLSNQKRRELIDFLQK